MNSFKDIHEPKAPIRVFAKNIKQMSYIFIV